MSDTFERQNNQKKLSKDKSKSKVLTVQKMSLLIFLC